MYPTCTVVRGICCAKVSWAAYTYIYIFYIWYICTCARFDPWLTSELVVARNPELDAIVHANVSEFGGPELS